MKALTVAVALGAFTAVPGPSAPPETVDVLGRLEAATAACRAEAEGLEALAAEPRLGGRGGMIDLAAPLAAAEGRAWRLAAEVEGLLSEAGRVWAGGEPASFSPVLVVAGEDWRSALARFEDARRRLGALAAAAAAGMPAPGRVCPLADPLPFASTWEEARPWGRVHHGADLDAAPGTPLVAVESGTILQAEWHWAGGWGIWLEGRYSGDVYYYAHLEGFAPEIAAMAEVEKGALLGWSGMSGNAQSPHLHFGWVPRGAGPWYALTGLADPYPLLAGLCR